jgi:hypothetical protein
MGETSENVMAAHNEKNVCKYAISRSLLVVVVVARQKNKLGSDNQVLL